MRSVRIMISATSLFGVLTRLSVRTCMGVVRTTRLFLPGPSPRSFRYMKMAFWVLWMPATSMHDRPNEEEFHSSLPLADTPGPK